MAGKAYYSIVHGHRIYYRVYGSGSPMILLHGFGRSGSTWQHILPYLQNYQLVVVDIPGYGHSRFIGQWRFREVTLLLETWLHKLKIACNTNRTLFGWWNSNSFGCSNT